MSKKTDELAARQEAALAKNQANRDRIEALKNQNSFLETRITELTADGSLTGEEGQALKDELTKSNGLLEELQDAILADEDAPADPPVE